MTSLLNPISFELNLSWKWTFSGKDIWNQWTSSLLWSNHPILVPIVIATTSRSLIFIKNSLSICIMLSTHSLLSSLKECSKVPQMSASSVNSSFFAPAASWCRDNGHTDFYPGKFQVEDAFERSNAAQEDLLLCPQNSWSGFSGFVCCWQRYLINKPFGNHTLLLLVGEH